MGSAVIVIMPPGFGDHSGFLDAPEPMLVEAFCSVPPIVGQVRVIFRLRVWG